MSEDLIPPPPGDRSRARLAHDTMMLIQDLPKPEELVGGTIQYWAKVQVIIADALKEAKQRTMEGEW